MPSARYYAKIGGVMEPGNLFDWTGYNFLVRSTVYDLTDRERVLWAGRQVESLASMSGFSLRHLKVLESPPLNLFLGDPVDADRDTMQNMLDSSLVAWLAHMKARAETR
jgi:hypothetical protein